MRELGVMQQLLEMLKPGVSGGSAADHSMDYEPVLVEVTKVVSNLASNKTNRLLIGECAIEDILRLIERTNSDEIKDNLLRAVMNLSIALENEDRIREQGGLRFLIDFFHTPDLPPNLLLQTSRVLVNLACNGAPHSWALVAAPRISRRVFYRNEQDNHAECRNHRPYRGIVAYSRH